MEEELLDLTPAKKTFSRIGFSLTALTLIGALLQAAVIYFLNCADLLENSTWFWLVTFLPLYLVAIPCCVAMLRKLPAETPEEHALGTGNAVTFFLIGCFLMYAGNLIGTMLSMLLSGGTAENAVAGLAMDSNPLKILFVVILAPVLEEFLFRKQLIDRTRRYGEKTAVLLSALTFGLLHQNLFQFFYAFGLGLIFAYIYLRTGRLRYTVVYHGIINFMGSVLAPWILSLYDLEAMAAIDPNAPTEELLALYADILPGMLIVCGYALVLVGLSIAGLVLFIIKVRRLIWKEGSAQLPHGTAAKTVYANAGMVIYMLLCLLAIILTLI